MGCIKGSLSKTIWLIFSAKGVPPSPPPNPLTEKVVFEMFPMHVYCLGSAVIAVQYFFGVWVVISSSWATNYDYCCRRLQIG